MPKHEPTQTKIQYDLLTIGDGAVDEFLKVHDASLHCDIRHENCEIAFKYGEKILVEEFRISPAGNAVNVAVGGATLGLNTAIYTELGSDFGAEIINKKLIEKRVSQEFVVKNKEGNTDIHPIIMFQGERTVFTYHAKKEYSLKHWSKPRLIYYTSVGPSYKDFQPLMISYIEKNPDVILAMNPGSIQIREDAVSLANILKYVDVLFLNKEEAKLATGYKITDQIKLEVLHKELIAKGVKLSVITDGTNGASTFDGKKLEKLGICDIGKKVDKTGAGDAFASGFVSAMLYGKSALEAMKWGTINSACCITIVGSTEGLATKSRMEELLKTAVFSPANF